MRMSVIPRKTRLWTGVTIADLVGLIPVLASAFGAVLGAVVLGTGWQLFSDRRRRGVVAFRVGVIERDDEGAR